MENELTFKQKFLLVKNHPKLFYLKVFKSFEIYFDQNPVSVNVQKVMLLSNN